VLYVYTKDAEGKIHSKRDIGVFFIPMTGAIQKNQPVRPETVSDHVPAAPKPPAEDAKPAAAKPSAEDAKPASE
jgi:protein-L-isoaspartate(D-aspartate) O-methyltransferase